MVVFHSDVSLPEGKNPHDIPHWSIPEVTQLAADRVTRWRPFHRTLLAQVWDDGDDRVS